MNKLGLVLSIFLFGIIANAQEKVLDSSSGSINLGTTHPDALLSVQNTQEVSGWSASSSSPLIGNIATGDIHPSSSSFIVSPEKIYSVTEYMELKKDRDRWKAESDASLLVAYQSDLDKRMIISSLFQLSLSGDIEKLKEVIRQVATVVLLGNSQSEGLKNKNQ